MASALSPLDQNVLTSPVDGLDSARSLFARVLGRDRLPRELADVANEVLQHPELFASGLAFVHATSSLLRVLAWEYPDETELRRWSVNAQESLASALGTTDPVLAEERRVWARLSPVLARERREARREVRERLDVYDETLWWYGASGELDRRLYEAQRRLYTLTHGAIADDVLTVRRAVHPAAPCPDRVEGVLGTLTGADVIETVEAIRRDGYALFPGLLPAETVDHLVAFARRHPVRPMIPGSGLGEAQSFETGSTKVTRYVIRDEDALARTDVRAFLFDPTILAVTRAYLGCEPVATRAFLRWSRPVLDVPDPAAAQLFHFDLNHLNFLKVFVYLTDVEPGSGPHSFVRGTHRTKPAELLRDGRIPDDEIQASCDPADVLDFTGPKGTLILEDTRGFHRGKMLDHGERLVLTTCYADSLAGKPGRRFAVRADAEERRSAAVEPRLWHRLMPQAD